ncbi:MAG: DUF4411 family protein, partial [Rhodobacteraceae bacterium]|nr:DUF4411 family protein [Paracoccaceae bacterium]
TYQNLFLPIIIHEIEPYLRDLTNWVNELGKPDAEKQRFLASGDYWLIAYAMVNQCKVVTLEAPAPPNSPKIKIPDVCRAFNLDCMKTFDLLQIAGARFVL